ncbi:hypothetical protein BJY52DRAFT_1321170 [Lactarius psammicola]|nr:hypothetical protein BJY52DRAFT_1321170 [Lactarius psammicola]
MATTTPHAPLTPSARATTTPHAPPTPLRAKQCAEGQRAPSPPLASLMQDAPPPAPRLTHPRLLPHTPLCAYAVRAGGAGGGARKGGTRNEGRCNPSGEWPGAAQPAPCPRMRTKVGGCTGGAAQGGAGCNPKEGHTRTEGCTHEGGAPPAFSQRREDVAARETKGAGTLSAPSRPVNRLRKISVK